MNTKTFLFTTSPPCQLNPINYSDIYLPPPPPPPPPQPGPTHQPPPGEFLIKLPICFKLALSRVHLCKIPDIMKDLSIGGGKKSVWVDFAVNWLAEGWDWGRARPPLAPRCNKCV